MSVKFTLLLCTALFAVSFAVPAAKSPAPAPAPKENMKTAETIYSFYDPYAFPVIPHLATPLRAVVPSYYSGIDLMDDLDWA